MDLRQSPLHKRLCWRTFLYLFRFLVGFPYSCRTSKLLRMEPATLPVLIIRMRVRMTIIRMMCRSATIRLAALHRKRAEMGNAKVAELNKTDGFMRAVPFSLSNVDEDENGDGLTFEGYAAVFNSPTRIDNWMEGTFDETILPGAFANSIRSTTPKFQFDHGRHPLIGSIPLGNITEMKEDNKGLFVRARMTDNWLVQPVRDAVANQSIDGMSFRFTVPDGGEKWTEIKGQVPQRQLSQVDCSELGPVVFPAYDKTTAKVRSMLGLPVDDEIVQTEDTGASGSGESERGNSEEHERERERIRVTRNRFLIVSGILRP